jgi:hypothetical protein
MKLRKVKEIKNKKIEEENHPPNPYIVLPCLFKA